MIIIYGTSGCGFCDLAKQLCSKLGIKPEFRDIGYKKWYLEYKDHQNDNMRMDMPYIIVDGNPIGGYGKFVEYIRNIKELGDI